MSIKLMTTCSCGCDERVFAIVKIRTFSFSWTMDAGEWFMYFRFPKKWYRFSSCGYMSWRDVNPLH